MLLDELAGTELAAQPVWHIGISMVLTDVHVNRAPIGGTIRFVKHRRGKFLSLRDPRAASINERQTVIIGDGNTEVALVQIASRLVRQIVSFVRQGDTVAGGDRIGMIRFGSQVDVIIPLAVASECNIDVGQRVVAGETIICYANRSARELSERVVV
jgi:phosphatidylserine decarboxylase